MGYLPQDFSEVFALVTSKRNRIPLNLFLLLCFNVLLAPAVQAATPGGSRFASYAIALLGLVTLSLCVYLFVVIFQPEKF
ncbi:potassium-transporting ATPase subunit F [aff. Roholtiella sp. LEGE 12411]|uniref:potassium-transporting ATPase subunit F n=1 Tax=aff. Roholtiella sp. LEGE 12411 TaxID=1828822 RepID=UPI00187E134B|nr:potassium-transporting ATPase subunit F [aff. Roholtiella sp. LEGE 12411]MBE9034543.1 potassium-transporting ATPase subunit F [aff. Roholtiella sp. LEGE 12411]